MTHALLLFLVSPGLCLASAPPQRWLSVSIVQLIANPQKYDGMLVTTVGFLTLGEHPALYLHREDAEHALLSNGIWLETTDRMRRHRDDLDHKYVQVVGIFRAGNAGHDNYKAGGITEISDCSVWPSLARDDYP